MLRKNGPIGAAGAPCVFLVETSDGHALCGAGEVRPTSCRAYPAVADGDDVRALSGLCPCRAWTDADLGDAERDAARTAAAEESADAATIMRWNDHVQAGARRHSLDEFCVHLLSGTHLLSRDAS